MISLYTLLRDIYCVYNWKSIKNQILDFDSFI